MTESSLPGFIKTYLLHFYFPLATPIYCISAFFLLRFVLSSLPSSVFISILKGGFVLFLPLSHSLEPRGCPIDSDQIPLNFVFSPSILHGNFQKAYSFKTIVHCSYKNWENLLVCRILKSWKENTNHCLHWDERDMLNFFRLTQRYNWMSTEIMSLIERLKVCMKGHHRN